MQAKASYDGKSFIWTISIWLFLCYFFFLCSPILRPIYPFSHLCNPNICLILFLFRDLFVCQFVWLCLRWRIHRAGVWPAVESEAIFWFARFTKKELGQPKSPKKQENGERSAKKTWLINWVEVMFGKEQSSCKWDCLQPGSLFHLLRSGCFPCHFHLTNIWLAFHRVFIFFPPTRP